MFTRIKNYSPAWLMALLIAFIAFYQLRYQSPTTAAVVLPLLPAAAPGGGPINVSNDAANRQYEAAISVDPTNADRRVIVAMSKEGGNRKIRAYHTTNGGQSWTSLEVSRPPGPLFNSPLPWVDRYSNPNAPTRTVASTADFDLPSPAIPAVGALDGVKPLPSIDVDRSSGSHHGRIWVAYADYSRASLLALRPERMDIFVTWSDDRGVTWNPPVKINLDDTNTSQFHPWLDVDDVNGSVGVVYYTTETDSVNNKIVHVEYAQFIAGDPGNRNNWTNRRVTNAGSNADSGNCADSICFAEYIGLHKQSHWAYLAWTSLHTGEPEVFHLKVTGW